ncbi:hypothetical protein [Phenylobacterium sp.]|uniref:hypothetical protein n=1 Tax=Phenylobacterium sp. TaxID=1871053 RepID=UPI001228BF96|nr:hypothetical protein [Phenylobacterium sp.]THD59916.1 MAG: hypothetical protein E8A12_11180 [Phenylobacterium sp.]
MAAALCLTWGQRAIAAAPTKPGAGDAPSVSELIVTASRTVSELTVSAKMKCLEPDRMGGHLERPRIVSTFPAKGSVVRPGLLVIRVTFNQAMACDGLLTAAPPLENPCPGAVQEMLLSYDRKTVRTVCLVSPGVEYGVWFSQDPTQKSFVSLAGLPSEAYRLNFSTSTGPAITSVCEAMAADEDTARQIRQRRPLDCSSGPTTAGG